MSLQLALDTATDWGSVAVGPPGGLISEIVVGDRRGAAGLVAAVEEALRVAGAGYGDLGGILLADGPGSFTGLRIGTATVKGILRRCDGLAVRTAPSLQVAAVGAWPFVRGPVAALYDALRGQVFGAVYDVESGPRGDPRAVRTLVAPVLATVAELVRLCPVVPALAVGDGASVHAEAVRSWTGRDPVAPPLGAPRAAGLLALAGVEDAGLALVDDVEAFEPRYGRPAEAQVRWEREHGRPVPDPARRGG